MNPQWLFDLSRIRFLQYRASRAEETSAFTKTHAHLHASKPFSSMLAKWDPDDVFDVTALESALAHDDERDFALRASRMDRSIRLMLDDGPDPLPTGDLVARTLQRVKDQQEKAARTTAAVVDPQVLIPFRLRDFAVAAAIFLVSVLSLFPVFVRQRDQQRLMGCAANLREVGTAVFRHADMHRELPFFGFNQDMKAPLVGARLVDMHDERLIPDLRILDCPSNGRDEHCRRLPVMEELVRQFQTDPDAIPPNMDHDYAMNLGPRAGAAIDPALWKSPASRMIPLVSDRPDRDRRGAVMPACNSPNHDGFGQNAFMADGSVRWLSRPRITPNDQDIYLNRSGRSWYGEDAFDAVLSPMYIRTDRLDGY